MSLNSRYEVYITHLKVLFHTPVKIQSQVSSHVRVSKEGKKEVSVSVS